MAVSFAGQNRFTEAESLHQSLYQQLKAINAGEASQMITVIKCFVDTLIRARKTKDAEVKLLSLIPLQVKLLGENHPDTVLSRNKLAGLRVNIN